LWHAKRRAMQVLPHAFPVSHTRQHPSGGMHAAPSPVSPASRETLPAPDPGATNRTTSALHTPSAAARAIRDLARLRAKSLAMR
jgi:hypothetical protein